jgi:hypothetical protein
MERSPSFRDIPRGPAALAVFTVLVAFVVLGYLIWRIDRFEHVLLIPGGIILAVGAFTGLYGWYDHPSRHVVYEAGWKLSLGLFVVGQTAEPSSLLWASHWVSFTMWIVFLWLAKRAPRRVDSGPSDRRFVS